MTTSIQNQIQQSLMIIHALGESQSHQPTSLLGRLAVQHRNQPETARMTGSTDFEWGDVNAGDWKRT